MIAFLFLLLFFIVWAAVAFLLTGRGMGGAWQREGPSTVGSRVRSRNRVALGATVAVVVVLAVLEALVPAVSDAVLNLQYALGDAVGVEPTLVYATGNGTVSWGLYLAVVLGTLAGLLAGSLGSVRRYPVLNGLSPRTLV